MSQSPATQSSLYQLASARNISFRRERINFVHYQYCKDYCYNLIVEIRLKDRSYMHQKSTSCIFFLLQIIMLILSLTASGSALTSEFSDSNVTAKTVRLTPAFLVFDLQPLSPEKSTESLLPSIKLEYGKNPIKQPGKHDTVEIPSRLKELINFKLNGVSYWAYFKPGSKVVVKNHPCCGIQVDNDSFLADRFAIWPVNPAGKICSNSSTDVHVKCSCPGTSRKLVPGLAKDKFARCIKPPVIRIINLSGTRLRYPYFYDPEIESLLHDSDSVSTASYQNVEDHLNTAHSTVFVTQIATDNTGLLKPEYLTLSPSSRYSVWVTSNGISRITYDGSY